ncbi:MAG: tryptophan-rich sensory protein [Firmicutes bacterium]|nr:tryptophan-rich sensory protein [Bacillota bacterium]
MNNIIKNIFHLFLPVVLGGIIGFIISDYIDYSNLIKPPLAPPKILFPIAWTIIYLLMGLSYYIFKKNESDTFKEDLIYYTQLTINLLWSIIFFIFKARLLASIWIIILDILVIYMIYLFLKKVKISAYLNIPYLLWILFATYLTISIYILN